MKFLTDQYSASRNSTHETFADLVFCALVVLVLFVMALAIEVSRRVRLHTPKVAEVTQVAMPDNDTTQLEAEIAFLTLRLSDAQHNLAETKQAALLANQEGLQAHAKLVSLQARLADDHSKLRKRGEEIQALRGKLAALANKSEATPRVSGRSEVSCQGWWEQTGLGRQPMREFTMEIERGRLSGRGTDIVGEFVLRGYMSNNEIAIQKTYFGKHTIDYQGTKCRDGSFKGKWMQRRLGSGPWCVSINRNKPKATIRAPSLVASVQ